MPPCILLVDDEPDFCVALRDILESDGHTVHAVHTVSAALALLEQVRPDLILTDLMMPGVDGLTLLRRIRNRTDWAAIPALVVSAKGTKEDIAEARRAGADGYLVKPFSAQELKTAVRQSLVRAEA